MKTKEELNALKTELETLDNKLAELTEEELEQVAGGAVKLNNLGNNQFPAPVLLTTIAKMESFF